MKKIIVTIVLVVLVGCNQSANDPKENNDSTENDNNKEVKSDVSISFSEVEVIARDKNLSVTGEVQTNADEFYYTLEQGDKVIIEETAIEVDDSDSEWEDFEINDNSLEIDEENEEAPFLKFYVKDQDRIINPNYVPIDLLFY